MKDAERRSALLVDSSRNRQRRCRREKLAGSVQ